MLDIRNRKPKKAVQYIIGGVVAFIVLVLWISMPLMNNSSWNTSVREGNPFKSKSADLSSFFDDGVGYESGAPGAPLSGALTDNPATSGEEMGSSLYQSGFDELSSDDGEAGEDVEAVKSGAGSSYVPSASSPAPSIPRGKLAKVASFGSGGSNSSTAGKHNKFFGGGAAEKPNFVPALANAPVGKAAKDSKMLASLGIAKKSSAKAIDLRGKEEAGRSGALSAFTKIEKGDTSSLMTNLESSAVQGGIVAGGVAGTLKKNAPKLSKKNITLPKPAEVKDNKDDDKYKQLILRAAINGILGPMFGSVGKLMAAQITASVSSKPLENQNVDTIK